MSSKFLKLNPEKQDRIVNAAIKEFVQKGFKNASTDEIVKEANISKGSLFYYFKDKKGLFLYLYDYCSEIVMNEFFAKIDLNEHDILKRFREMLLLKIELIKRYPEIFEFMKVAYFEDAAEVKSDLERRNKEMITRSYQELFGDIDLSKFREDIDAKRAVNIIIWTMEGFSSQQQEKAKSLSLNDLDFDEILAEMDHYIDLLKKCFYK
ncbi:TetR/AcrR family transcriptional regulator [Polycladomyces sp. WAk]|uniref:TetR/AcrR family transcriptional regulator n=1 Tax=Polycladomyces zharkentensis TaxID=2807616 RepID=A0ABS2WK89_9BACL|nr:TetR/AcrR family transcriptional regulator [Polycladomyces sp. WAk]MBN2909970.1 TetR/AcrR family transcriptional regulator [Polycladomyces sp. WAk]